jgi:hypothetical protein
VSVTEAPAPPAKRCHQCEAPMAAEQDWCLECGTAVTARVLKPPSWRVPIAMVLGVIAVLAVALTLALVSLSSRPQGAPSTQGPAATAPTSAAPPATSTPAPASTSGAPSSPAGDTAPVPSWPAGLEAYTLVVLTASDRAAAEREARSMLRKGTDAGILRSDDYRSFPPARWIVWRGRYRTRAAAADGLRFARERGKSGYVTYVQARR